MGKTALFAIAAFVAMGAIYGMSTTGGMLGTTEAIAEQRRLGIDILDAGREGGIGPAKAYGFGLLSIAPVR